MKEFKNGLKVVEDSDAMELISQLTPWDKVRVMLQLSKDNSISISREELLNFFGYNMPSIRDFSAIDICHEFYADELLRHMNEFDILDYIEGDSFFQERMLENINIDDLIEHFFKKFYNKKQIQEFFDKIAEKYNDDFMEWLHGTNYMRTEEEWKAFQDNFEKK